MFRRYSLKARLMLMVTPVFVGLSLLSALLIYQGYLNLREAKGIVEATQYFHAASNLIHELQKERGVSGLYLVKKVAFEKLKEQRTATDSVVSTVQNFIASHPDDIMLQDTQLLKQLTAVRIVVDGKGDAGEATGKYGELIRAFIQTQVSAAQKHHVDGLESILGSQSILEMAKENMGRMRAAGSSALASDKAIDVFQLSQLNAYYAGVLVNIQSPGLNVGSDTRASLEKMLESPAWNEINAIVITIVNKANEGFYGYPSFLFFDKVTALIEQLHGIMDTEVEHIGEQAHQIYQKNLRTTLILLVVTVVAQIVVFIFSWITLNEISGKLQNYGVNLYDGSGQTARASTELSASSTELSSGMSEQAAALQETVSALEEVRTMVEKNADSAAKAKEVVVVASDSSRRGKEAVDGISHAIGEIRESTTAVQTQLEASNNELSEILKVISEIGSKTRVINDIVFQTKLLSFNASVEAARAGEHGKGFAVVAEEVGNLAQMSGTSAREISQLLDSGIQRVEAIIADSKQRMSSLIQDANGKVEAGTNTAQRLGEVFQEISGKILEVSDRVAEIAAASQEQSSGVSEIAKAMHQLEQVTNTSNDAANRSASSAEKLNEQARNLESISRQLEDLVSGIRVASKGMAPSASPRAHKSVATVAKPSPKVAREPVQSAKSEAPVISLSSKRKEKSAAAAKAPAPAAVASTASTGGAALSADEVPSATDSRFEEI